MKAIRVLFLAALSLAAVSCTKYPQVDNPIDISSPEPAEAITKVTLDPTQQGYVEAGNAMALRLLRQMYSGENLVCSPLSLQYALAMAANGAQGQTLQEILDFLGYGAEGIETLNAYSKTLLEQLPAVDLDVNLKLTDALLVNDRFPLLPSFKTTVEQSYYAAVENMPFSDAARVADRINEWTSRSTNGFIDKIMDRSDISRDAAAYLMNVLYFKARWAGSRYNPMFDESLTREADFTLADGGKTKVQMMNTMSYFRYAIMDGFRVLALPYANHRYFMYILLPDGNDLSGMLDKLQGIAWSDITDSFLQDAEVYVKMPEFDIENKYDLSETLGQMGVKRAFMKGHAQFDGMFDVKEPDYFYWIEKVLQKARISVDERGTEAAAVTVVEIGAATSVGPGEEPKRIYFHADHPFAFVIGESTSGTILFEGTFTGR